MIPRPRRKSAFVDPQSIGRSAVLFGGFGAAKNYTWAEEQYEIDVSVLVPAGTRTRDISFKATPKSVDLRLSNDDGTETVLLDGTRQMRGRVCVDGVYWAIADGDEAGEVSGDERQVTVTIEKMISEPKDQFEVVEFDWGGVYPDDEEEVLRKKYEEGEELDVREYAASLGVDIDNINMTMVDKTMFNAGTGMNMTRSAMDELTKAGYMKEVTQQGDGTEYVTDDEGNSVPFSQLGENIGEDEIRRAVFDGADATGPGSQASRTGGIRDQLPFIDTPTQWQKSMPVEEGRIEDGIIREVDNGIALSSSGSANTDVENNGIDTDGNKETEDNNAVDPIDVLTVKRLKEILKEQNLKVSGNKQELRDRLRVHVNSMLEQQPGDEVSDQ